MYYKHSDFTEDLKNVTNEGKFAKIKLIDDFFAHVHEMLLNNNSTT